MFIKAEVIRRIGYLDEGFGRGYGEENDFCARAAALGYRNVAAGGVLVEHKESISFQNERASLVARNQPRLNKLYPEYTPLIMEFERQDGLRQLRWALDRARLERARTGGTRFTLVVSNALEGGTAKAITDIETYIGYGGTETVTLRVASGGLLELEAKNPLLRASFLPGKPPRCSPCWMPPPRKQCWCTSCWASPPRSSPPSNAGRNPGTACSGRMISIPSARA